LLFDLAGKIDLRPARHLLNHLRTELYDLPDIHCVLDQQQFVGIRFGQVEDVAEFAPRPATIASCGGVRPGLRRLATRYEKHAATFLAMDEFAAVHLLLHHNESVSYGAGCPRARTPLTAQSLSQIGHWKLTAKFACKSAGRAIEFTIAILALYHEIFYSSYNSSQCRLGIVATRLRHLRTAHYKRAI
jgi:hypothetical protein